jgi:hypothetical protein
MKDLPMKDLAVIGIKPTILSEIKSSRKKSIFRTKCNMLNKMLFGTAEMLVRKTIQKR